MYYGYDYGKEGEKTKTVEVVRETADTDARVIYTEYSYDKLLRSTGEKIQINDKVDFATLDTTPLFDAQNKSQMLSVEDIVWSGTLENQYTYDAFRILMKWWRL